MDNSSRSTSVVVLMPSVCSDARPRSSFRLEGWQVLANSIPTSAPDRLRWPCSLQFRGGQLAAKTAKDAVEKFAEYFKETLSCVSKGYVTVFQESRSLYKITCNPPLRMTRRSGGHLYLIATQTLSTVEVDGGFKAKTREYSYRLVADENIAAADIIACHWHPHDSDLRSPHLHVAELPRVHFAISRVSLEDIVMT